MPPGQRRPFRGVPAIGMMIWWRESARMVAPHSRWARWSTPTGRHRHLMRKVLTCRWADPTRGDQIDLSVLGGSAASVPLPPRPGTSAAAAKVAMARSRSRPASGCRELRDAKDRSRRGDARDAAHMPCRARRRTTAPAVPMWRSLRGRSDSTQGEHRGARATPPLTGQGLDLAQPLGSGRRRRVGHAAECLCGDARRSPI